MNNEILDRLGRDAKEYKRVTQKLLDQLEVIDDSITDICEEANYYPIITIEKQSYKVNAKRSNIGEWRSLEIGYVDEGGYFHGDKIPRKVEDLGRAGFVHGDWNTPFHYANRREVLQLAKDAETLLIELEKKINAKITEASELTEKLHRVCEAIKK